MTEEIDSFRFAPRPLVISANNKEAGLLLIQTHSDNKIKDIQSTGGEMGKSKEIGGAGSLSLHRLFII